MDFDYTDLLILQTTDGEHRYTYHAGQDVLITADNVEDSTLWKQGYIDFIQSIASRTEYMDIALNDMDNDGIPELIINSNLDYEISGIYTWENNEVVFLYNDAIGNMEILNTTYVYSPPRFDATDPLIITGVKKQGDKINVVMSALFNSWAQDGNNYKVSINGNDVADSLDSCVSVMAENGVNVTYTDSDWGVTWDYTTTNSISLDWINIQLIDDSLDQVEEYIWNY